MDNSKVLKEEGHDPETYVFELSDIKKTPVRGKKSDNEEVSEDDKVEEEDEGQKEVVIKEESKNAEDKNTEIEQIEDVKEIAENKEIIKTDVKVEKNDSKELSKEEHSSNAVQNKPNPKENSLSAADDVKENKDNLKKDDGSDEAKIKQDDEGEQSQNEAKSLKEPDVESVSKDSTTGTKTVNLEERPSGTQTSGEFASPKSTMIKEDKPTPEANGIIDNEDSINLTIGEDEEKLLVDEEDSSQEKDHKDEGHGSTGHKKTTAGEKTQEKTNQEKMDGKRFVGLYSSETSFNIGFEGKPIRVEDQPMFNRSCAAPIKIQTAEISLFTSRDLSFLQHRGL
ncbi:hypothetical protein J6590_083251 [Homalodisca vitripennis]|nr:hypothetical protein J6590_083251 [Homalodisca vitripennis]